MSRSKLSQSGELVIDHRDSPGISLEWARANLHHLIASGATTIVGGGKKFETGVKNCAHCNADVVLHPQRKRDREWCAKCDAYICDPCGLLKKLGSPHMPAAQVIERIFTRYQRSF